MQSLVRSGIRVAGNLPSGLDSVASHEALDFVAELEARFGHTRTDLLAARIQRQAVFDAGGIPKLPHEPKDAEDHDWRVLPAPADLRDRRVEITGPVNRKMMVHALNSGANVFMADFEDSFAPRWSAVLEGQRNLLDAAKGKLSYEAAGETHGLNATTATLTVRPRGWHLDEPHVLHNGTPVSASLFDAGLFLFHCSSALHARGSAPYLYLPKLETRLEARLWARVFDYSEERLGLRRGTIRATVLIETIEAALQMDAILLELKDHASGLNAGRWDYTFSIIKKFRERPDFVLPDRDQVTMDAPFMKAYTDLVVQTCHRRGAHAIGGMAAFVPNRKKPASIPVAFAKVREDKTREALQGFDGTWVAHPDLVMVARDAFDNVLHGRPNQLSQLRPDVLVSPTDLVSVKIPGATVTAAGVRHNVAVGLRYLDSLLGGNAAVNVFDLMEDVATAEIARSQLWQWVHHAVPLSDGTRVSAGLVQSMVDEEFSVLRAELGDAATRHRLGEARDLLLEVSLGNPFAEFLTPLAYSKLESLEAPA